MSSYNEDDAMGRHKYDGGWSEGLQSGEGVMTFKSGDTYQGEFKENLPDGKGEFIYVNGDKEVAVWGNGQRHGLSKYFYTLFCKHKTWFFERTSNDNNLS